MNNHTHWPSLAAPLILIGLAALGLVPLVWFGVSHGGSLTWDVYVWRVLRFTILQAAASTLLSVGFAVPVARALARQNFPGRTALLSLFGVPLALPVIVGVLGLVSLYGQSGVLGGWFPLYGFAGIVLAHVFYNLPLAVRLLHEALQSTAPENHRLAAQLGLRDFGVFSHVDWPALKPALPRVAALIFLLCAASFVIVLTLGGAAATTLEVAIYQSLRMDFNVTRAVTLSVVQILLSSVLVLATGRLAARVATQQRTRLLVHRLDGQGFWQRVVDIVFILLAMVLVIPPLLAVVASGIATIEFSPLLAKAILTSAALGLTAACLTLLLSWPLARLQSQGPRMRRLALLSSLLGLIVPPAVMATGWFLALRGVSGGVLMAGAMVAVLSAFMAIPFTTTVLGTAFATLHASHERLCANLGISGWPRFWLIDLPLMKGAAAQAAIMAFVLSLGDLTAITLLGTQGLVTLPSLVAQQMGHYQSQAAGGTALILAGLCLVLTFVSQKVSKAI